MRPSSAFRRAASPIASPPTAASPGRVGLLNLALSATVWLAVLGGLLYSQGRTYRNAYLSTVGVPPSLFAWDRGAIAYVGMDVGIHGFFPRLFINAALLATLIATTSIGIHMCLRWRQRSVQVSARPVSPPPAESIPASISIVHRLCSMVLIIATACMGVTFLIRWVQRDADRNGVNDARNVIRAMETCSPSVLDGQSYLPVQVTRATPAGNVDYIGFTVGCNDKRCALYDPARHRTQIVPLDNLVRFDTVAAEHVYVEFSESAVATGDANTNVQSSVVAVAPAL